MPAATTDAPPVNKRNIVVVGGSYSGTFFAECAAAALHDTHRVIVIEKNSHCQHLFAFPRFSVAPGNEHLAFLPFTVGGFLDPISRLPPGFPLPQSLQGVPRPTPASALSFMRGTAAEIRADRVLLEGPRDADEVPFDYLAIATGSRLQPPGTLPTLDKRGGIEFFRAFQAKIERAQNVTLVGGGAVGVQMATDIKELYPEKTVTLVHSRPYLMNTFHPRLHEVITERAAELGVNVILGDRVQVPSGGYPEDAGPFDITLTSGRTIPTDFAILCTGQTPLSGALRTLVPDSITPSGHVRVRPSMQVADARFPRVFALGDVAESGGQKSALAGFMQATVAAENVWRMHYGAPPRTEGAVPIDIELMPYAPMPAEIHLTLGFKRNVVFRNPRVAGGEPECEVKDDGLDDLDIKRLWEFRAPGHTDFYV